MKKILLLLLVVANFSFVTSAYADKAVIEAYPSGCDYFIADGNRGYYLLEWFGGYNPSEGDIIVGEIGSYGMKKVYYPKQELEGQVWVEDFLLSEDSVVEQYKDYCN